MTSRETRERTSAVEATHVVLHDGTSHKIASKWGINSNGRPAKPSEGGFGVVTESGRVVSMWEATAYFRENE